MLSITKSAHAQIGIGRIGLNAVCGEVAAPPNTILADAEAYTADGAINAKYQQFKNILGNPVTQTSKTPDGTAYFRDFDSGSIYWIPHQSLSNLKCAHYVHGGMFHAYATLRNIPYSVIFRPWPAYRFFLGLPVTDEHPTSNGVIQGSYQAFEQGGLYVFSGAAINQGDRFVRGYSSTGDGAFAVFAPAFWHYDALGGPRGILGYPTGGFADITKDGYLQTFEYGNMYVYRSDNPNQPYNPNSSCYELEDHPPTFICSEEVNGAILSKYNDLQGNPVGSGCLGLPISDEKDTADGGRISYFEHGFITSYPDSRGTHSSCGEGTTSPPTPPMPTHICHGQCTLYYYELTNPNGASSAEPCIVIRVLAPDEPTARALAQAQAHNYDLSPIDAATFDSNPDHCPSSIDLAA